VSANADIARLFAEMADALELLGENAFRVNALRKVARTAEDSAEDLAELARADVKTLEAIPGIGASSARKIVEFATTGGMHEHAELLAKLPEGLMAVLRVPGLGPKTVKLLWEQGGVTDLATLKSKLESGALEGLPRMGAKRPPTPAAFAAARRRLATSTCWWPPPSPSLSWTRSSPAPTWQGCSRMATRSRACA